MAQVGFGGCPSDLVVVSWRDGYLWDVGFEGPEARACCWPGPVVA